MNASAALRDALGVYQAIVAGDLAAHVEAAAAEMVRRIRGGGTIYWCGNGGSAADAQHLAAELVGKFYFDRPPVRSHAITTNSSTLTALVNDYPPELVFRRQVEAYVTDKDVFVGLSTSGNSANVLLAMEAAKARGAFTIAMTGETGGKLAPVADLALKVPSKVTPRIQEGHILLGHTTCELVEHALFG